MEVSYLPDPERHPLWQGIKELLRPAADFGGIPVHDEDELVWIAFEGPTLFGAVTTLCWNDGEAEIRLGAGTRLADWIEPMEATVSAWARDCGAKTLTLRGRKGWARFAARFGWAPLGEEDGRMIFGKGL